LCRSVLRLRRSSLRGVSGRGTRWRLDHKSNGYLKRDSGEIIAVAPP